MTAPSTNEVTQLLLDWSNGDKAALDDLYDRVLRLLPADTGGRVPFTKADFERGFALATNDDYAGKLADLHGDLGDSQNFKSVTDDAAGKQFVMFLNWDLIEDEILQAMRGYDGFGDMSEAADNLEPLRAFGITSGAEGDYTVSHLIVSLD